MLYIILQFLGGLSIPLRQLNNLRKTGIRWEIEFVFFFQSLGHKSSAKKVAPRKPTDALLWGGEADKHVRVQDGHAEPPAGSVRIGCGSVAALNIPPRWDVDRHDRQAGAGDERERHAERSAHGGLEGEAEDRVEDDVTGSECGRKRVLR